MLQPNFLIITYIASTKYNVKKLAVLMKKMNIEELVNYVLYFQEANLE